MEITKTDKGWEYDGVVYINERSALGVKKATEEESNSITLTEEELRDLLDTYGKANGTSYYLDQMSDMFDGHEEQTKFKSKWKEYFGEEYDKSE